MRNCNKGCHAARDLASYWIMVFSVAFFLIHSSWSSAVMYRDTFRWGGGRFDQLTNYCQGKKFPENTVANSLAVWLTFEQHSCKFENIGGGRDAPRPHLQIPDQMVKTPPPQRKVSRHAPGSISTDISNYFSCF